MILSPLLFISTSVSSLVRPLSGLSSLVVSNGGKLEMNGMSNEREKRTVDEPSAFLTLQHAIL